VHWGEEYALRHNQSQAELATTFINQGADLIIGHHPHVVQGIDFINDTVVFYSLGNYIFDQYFSKDVQEGLILSMVNQTEPTILLTPVTSQHSISQPRVMQPKQHAQFLEKLARKSHPHLAPYISSGKLPLFSNLASSDKLVMMQNKYVH
jgi:poly-gamma-glutamate synthesis protein (capsule biosynthesis protein)